MSQTVNSQDEKSASMTRCKRVIVFAPDLLPISQTFIREQVRTLQDWHPVLVGERLVPNGLSLQGMDTRLLCPPEDGRLHRQTYVLCRILGLPHPLSIWRLHKLGASLIHAHFGPAAVDIWPLARALSLPMLVTLHGYDINTHRKWWESGKGGWQLKCYPKKLLRMAKDPRVHFVAVSEALRTRAIRYGIPKDKIAVSYIGVDTNKFHPLPNPVVRAKKIILFVGRLVEKKGVEFLIRAFSTIKGDHPEAELVLVGDGNLRQELQKLANNLGSAVKFAGAQSNEKVLEFIQEAYVMCLPSITAENGDAEGMGMVLLEAQACGVPVISSALGGSSEGLIDGQTGFAVAERDTDALADRLKKILCNQELHSRLSVAGVKFVSEKFSLSDCSRKMEAIYNSVVNSSL